ncbi:MAG: hypothetical protein FGM32_11360 [Candidatus Kapabacteria bacterium]|nr:hypothetical protein [Candidatus Kapabacteria bacterium]
MTIWEYLQSPHPWFDTTNYQPWQIVLFTLGAVLWIVAYVIILRAAVRRKQLIIPVAAVICNFGAEVGAAIFFVPDMGKALVVAYWMWMLLDMVIIYNLFRYGREQFNAAYLRNNFGWLMMMSFIFSITLSSSFMVRYDLPMGVIDNYIVNVVMSVAFIGLLLSEGPHEYSMLLGWTKFLGTGVISVMFQTKYSDNLFLSTLYVTVAFFDILYLILLQRMMKVGSSR